MAKVELIVFLSLVLDLFAFTIPLPLFPRIIEWYTVVRVFPTLTHSSRTYLLQRESSDPNGFLSRTLQLVSSVRGVFYKSAHNSQKWDVVLLGTSSKSRAILIADVASSGGLMGSVFSYVCTCDA
jgi:hypothetical protein